MFSLSFVVFDLLGVGGWGLGVGVGVGCVCSGGMCACGVWGSKWNGIVCGAGSGGVGCVVLGVGKQGRLGRCVRVIRGQTGGGWCGS